MEKITNNKGGEINLQKKREKVRRKLRDKGVLPKIGESLNESQMKIMNQISNNDFSFYEQYKINQHMETKTYKLKLYNELERPLIKKTKIINELVVSGILPTSEDQYDNEKNDIINFVSDNLHLSIKDILHNYKDLMTPEYSIWLRTKNAVYKNKRRRHSDDYFNISVSDIEIPVYCPYINTKLTTNREDCYLPNYYTIDRIDSTKGYVKGNIQIISKLANTMKSNATKEELITFSKNILKIFKDV